MDRSDARIAVYSGSFDPITLGHLDVIGRCSTLVDRLVIGVGINIEKHSLFSIEERVEMVEQTITPYSNVEVRPFQGLAVDFVRKCGARVMIRGVRSLTDIEAEFTMALANRKLAPEIETIFLMANEEHSHISSSLIKQIASLAGPEELGRFVPEVIVEAFRQKMAKKEG